MSKMKLKKGDLVKVIAGKDKGKDGKIIAVNHKDNMKFRLKHLQLK